MDVLVLNENFQTVAIIDKFESFIWADRYNSLGDFEIKLMIGSEISDYIQENYYLWISESEHSMIIDTLDVESDVEDGAYLTFKGESLEAILKRRVIWPQAILSGNFQNGIKKLINENVISPTDPDRRIDNFIFEESNDPRITELTLDTQFTGTNLYEAISKLCQDRNIGFKVILNDNNQFVFSLYMGADRSYNQMTNPYVIFSPEFDNLLNSNYFLSIRNLKTVTIVAGEGEGLARRSVTVGEGVGLARRELFTDARDVSSNGGSVSPTTYNNHLGERGLQKLDEYDLVELFEGEADATRVFIFNKDFFLGDVVQVANEYGMEATSRITEIIFSEDEAGYAIIPTFQMITEEE